jgi:hypothetical protein
MTCAHVLGLMDAGPFADYPQAHLDAAWEHARQCPTCGPALQASDRLAIDLAALPQPVPPPDLAAAVIARIVRIEIEEEPPLRARAHDWSPLITVLGGLAAAVAIALSAPSMLFNGIPHMWTPVLAAGLELYSAGLFAPLRGRRPR